MTDTPASEKLLPVILIHGLGASSRYMVPAALCLAADVHVYALDLPGFGQSDKPPHALNVSELSDALDAWMRVEGIERAALVGHSLGCLVVTDFAHLT